MQEKSAKKSPWYFWGLVFLLGPPGFMLLVFYPCQNIRESAARMASVNNLKMLGSALHGYYKSKKCFPPSAAYDPTGKPLYSWRVLLLPYLEHEPLYKQFHLDEPWDSPHNLTLLPKIPEVFRPPLGEAKGGFTHYQVLVGPGTAFERPGLTKDDFPGGVSKTVFIVEAEDAVPWTKPVDLAYAPGEPLPGFFRQHFQPSCLEFGSDKLQFQILLGEGQVRSLLHPFYEPLLRALIDRNNKDKIKADF